MGVWRASFPRIGGFLVDVCAEAFAANCCGLVSRQCPMEAGASVGFYCN